MLGFLSVDTASVSQHIHHDDNLSSEQSSGQVCNICIIQCVKTRGTLPVTHECAYVTDVKWLAS